MKLKAVSQTFTLRATDIDAFSDWLQQQMDTLPMERRNRLRVRLILEELLLRLQEHFGEEAGFTATVEGVPSQKLVRLELAGAAYNPLREENTELGDWNSSLLTAIGLHPKYSYSFGRNTLRLTLPTKQMNPALKILIALLAGLGFGFAGMALLPLSVQQWLTDSLFTPAYDFWSRILNALAGPIIFFMALTTMLNTRQLTKQGGKVGHVLVRYFALSFLVATISMLAAAPFFSLKDAGLLITNRIPQQILDSFLQFVPQNIVEPFSTANTPQLLVLAFLLGAALISLSGRVDTLKAMVRQVNIIGLLLSRWLSLLVPFFVGIFLCFEIWTGRTATLAGMWKPLLISAALSVLVFVLFTLYFSLRLHLSPLLCWRKVLPPVVTALKTGTLDTAFQEAEGVCSSALGIDRTYIKSCLPQGLVLYMPVSGIGTLIFTLFAALTFEVQIDVFWYLMAILLAVLLFVATPPVPGINILAYAALFTTLGIPDEALIDAMIFDILFGILAGAGNLGMLQIETALQANRLGLLNQDKLRAPAAKRG